MKFFLPKETNVKLVVYDILGKQVAVLAEGRYSKGKRTLIWDGSKHASGFYYYTLTTEDEVAIGKMLLLK